jgi:hypothetical protein
MSTVLDRNRRKGLVEAAGFAFLVGLTVIITMMLFFLVTSEQGSITERTIETTLDYRLSQIQSRSAIQTTMQDKMWRNPDVNRGEYGDLAAYKVMSYWVSTEEGNDLHIDSDNITYQKAENDIRNYLETKMDRVFIEETAEPMYYNLTVTYEPQNSANLNSKQLTATPEEYIGGAGSRTVIQYPLAVRSKDKAYIRLGVTTEPVEVPNP